GVDLESSLQAHRLATDHPGRILWSAGLHPHDASRWPEQESRLVALAADADAIGECGLDFYRNLSPREDQLTAFRAQLDLAAGLGKPAIIHCRDAFAEMYDVLEEVQLGEQAVLHCWTGGPKWTRRYRDLGVVFSFAGPVTFATGDTVRRGAAEAPPDRTLVETDTPYLTPPPDRRAANEPANVVKVGEALAGVWGIALEEVAAATTALADRVFGRP
ncbi:MAG: TatD family hydrolase, partial [Actinobacteria bacterium]|nr:TatD family hydrolase [Actinomycetota bacterium]